MGSRIEGDVHYAGNVSFGATVNLPPASVTAANIQSAAGIEATKQQSRLRPIVMNGTDSGDVSVDETKVIHVARASGTIQGFRAGAVGPCTGDSTVDVDLTKNGTTVLSAAIQLDNTQAAYVLVEGTIGSPAIVAGDVLEVSFDATVGTGTLATGVFAQLVIDESPQ